MNIILFKIKYIRKTDLIRRLLLLNDDDYERLFTIDLYNSKHITLCHSSKLCKQRGFLRQQYIHVK